MASVPVRRHAPTTPREAELLDDLADRLNALGLTTDVHHDLRQITARQPAVSDDGPIPVGLSQAVSLARSSAVAGQLAWLITLDDGFRGANGSRFERIAAGEDVATAARKIGHILALTGAPAPESAPVT